MSTVEFKNPVYVRSWAVCAGKKEGEGPLGDRFDVVCPDGRCGEKSWEKAEMKMVTTAWKTALQKAGMSPGDVGCALGGDLLNQCVSTSFGFRDSHIPFLGLYGACSTMAEGLLLGSSLVAGGIQDHVLCTASSHFCSAERQYRYPLAYGGQRPPTAQWTATACGAVVLSSGKSGICVTRAKIGSIYDPGVTDASNMGAAMAQSAYETLSAYFRETGDAPADYDLIVTGDLASVGKQLVVDLFDADGVDMRPVYDDCGADAFSQRAGRPCRRVRLRVLGGRAGRVSAAGARQKAVPPGFVLRHGRPAVPPDDVAGRVHPGICHLVCLEAEA